VRQGRIEPAPLLRLEQHHRRRTLSLLLDCLHTHPILCFHAFLLLYAKPDFELIFNQIFGLGKRSDKLVALILLKPSDLLLIHDRLYLELSFSHSQRCLSLHQVSTNSFLFSVETGELPQVRSVLFVLFTLDDARDLLTLAHFRAQNRLLLHSFCDRLLIADLLLHSELFILGNLECLAFSDRAVLVGPVALGRLVKRHVTLIIFSRWWLVRFFYLLARFDISVGLDRFVFIIVLQGLCVFIS
jgi:hypothetical protein